MIAVALAAAIAALLVLDVTVATVQAWPIHHKAQHTPKAIRGHRVRVRLHHP